MDKNNFLKQYAINYLSKYDSTKINLESILKSKISRIKDINKNDKNNLYKYINAIIKDLEKNNIINDEDFAYKKLINLFNQGRSEIYIKNNLYRKGIEESIIKKILSNFNKSNPGWEIKSARAFVKKKGLGKYESNKEKDFGKMARAGFNYNIIKDILKIH